MKTPLCAHNNSSIHIYSLKHYFYFLGALVGVAGFEHILHPQRMSPNVRPLCSFVQVS